MMRILKMLKFLPDHLKTKKMCKKMQLKLFFVRSYIPDQYKTEQMRDKTKLENGGNLESVPDCYKIQQMYDKAVNNYLHLLKFVADWLPYNSKDLW